MSAFNTCCSLTKIPVSVRQDKSDLAANATMTPGKTRLLLTTKRVSSTPCQPA